METFKRLIQGGSIRVDIDEQIVYNQLSAKKDDVKAMNLYMNRVTLATFSYFATGRGGFGEEPERFYHGFVLGLISLSRGYC